MVVDRQAVRELLETIKYTPAGCKEVLETLLAVVPLIEAGEEDQAIEAMAQAERERDSIFSKAGAAHTDYIRWIIRELDHYKDKRAMIEAALAEVDRQQDIIDELEALLPIVKAAWLKLDPKIVAAFALYQELASISSEINVDYLNELLYVDSDVSLLRDDAMFTLPLRAYDLARRYWAVAK